MKRKKKQHALESTLRSQRSFLRALVRHGGHVQKAAAAIGRTRDCHTSWLKRPTLYPEYRRQFRKAFRAAMRVRAQILKDTVADRAVEGFKRFGKTKDGGLRSEWWSKKTGFVTEDDDRFKAKPESFKRRTFVECVPSDVLTIFELKKLEPSYRDKQQVDVKGVVTHTHDVADDVKKLLADRESLDLANALARRMAVNAGGDGQSSN